MKQLLFSVYFIIFSLSVNAQNTDSITTTIDPKADLKELQKNIKEAKVLSIINQKPNYEQARKKIKAAFRNSQYEANKAFVLMEAGNVEYNCFETERNKPASGAKTNFSTLYLASEKGYNYFHDSYVLYNSPDSEGKINKKNNAMLQKKAWNLFENTDGFRMNAADAYKNKDWKSAHKCFNLFLKAIESDILNDYASKNAKISQVLSLYQNDSIVNHAKYYRALCSLKMDSIPLAISDLDDIKNNSFEQSTVLQELSKIYIKQKNLVELEKVLKIGVKNIPSNPWFARNLVNLYLSEKYYNEAIEVVDHLMSIDSINAEYISLKGQLVELQGDTIQALKLYEKSYQIDSLNTTINLNFGRIYFNQATTIENQYFDLRDYEEAYNQSMPLYLKSLDYYKVAFKLDILHENPTIGRAIRTITYKQFSRADCQNQDELIDLYNDVSRAYSMDIFPR